ncbi:MAG TPA: peptidylprolyl isomerase [Actinopolymorphaceae bacterium]
MSSTDDLFATLRTSAGDIRLKLLPHHAPKAVRNFVELAEGTREWLDPETGEKTTARFYDGLTFHRIISGFMIQTGCPLGTGTGGPGYRFADEIHPDLRFDRPFVLGMANAGPNTNGSQFFITVAQTPHLNGKYTIFGEVADQPSQEVVLAISKVATGPMDRPIEPVTLESVRIQRGDDGTTGDGAARNTP